MLAEAQRSWGCERSPYAAVGPRRGALPRAGAGGLELGFGALAGLLFKGGVSLPSTGSSVPAG